MSKNIKPLFNWARRIGDANINNRIIAKVMPTLIKEKTTLTDTMIEESDVLEVSQELYTAIKNSAENLLNTKYEEE